MSFTIVPEIYVLSTSDCVIPTYIIKAVSHRVRY